MSTTSAAIHPKASLVRAAGLGFRLLSFPRGRKGPLEERDWQVKDHPLYEIFHGEQNHGVVTGHQVQPGKFLADVDIDWQPGARVVETLVPRTDARFGRPTKTLSHLLYTTPEPLPSREFKDIDGKMLLELRGTKKDGTLGRQTMIPPSVHPGDPKKNDPGGELSWLSEEFTPNHVATDGLRESATWAATAMLMGRHWPKAGRHDLRLAYSRVLLEVLGLSDEVATRILEMACEAGGSDASGVHDAAQAIRDTRLRLNANEPATGARTVAELLPEGAKIVERLREWYGIRATRPVLLVAADFLAKAGTSEEWLVPRLAPVGGIVMFHGRPRSMKSLGALSMLVTAALGEPPWGVAEFRPGRPIRCAFFSEEDGSGVVAARLRWLLAALGVTKPPCTLMLSARCGLSLEEHESQKRIRATLAEFEVELAWFDTARAMAPGVDKGPAEAAPAVRFLRELLSETPLRSVGLTHHDVKPSRDGTDTRPRAEKSSGGALLAAADCPLGFSRLDERSTLVVPDRYKVGADPHPFRLQFESATPAGEQFRDFVRVIAVKSDERTEQVSRVQDAVLKVLREEWMNTTAIREAANVRSNDVVSTLGGLVAAGKLEYRAAARGAKEYRIARQKGLK